MHPILQNLRSSVESPGDIKNDHIHSVGIASRNDDEANLRRAQRDDNLPSAQVPVVDIFRDPGPKMAEERDLTFKASKSIHLDTDKKLKTEMFEPDLPGTSEAQRHIEASEILRNGQYTRSLEQWSHDNFIKNAKYLLLRSGISLGVTYLDDFLQTYIDNPLSTELVAQLVNLQLHCDEPVLKRVLGDISKRDSHGKFLNQWLVDLISCIYMIIRDEQTISQRLSAILTCSNHLALYFAKKASGGFYPTADKLAKTHTYFRRIILAILRLAENVGSYKRNCVPPQPFKKSKVEVEPSDESYMFSLRGALEQPDSEEEEDEETWIRQMHH